MYILKFFIFTSFLEKSMCFFGKTHNYLGNVLSHSIQNNSLLNTQLSKYVNVKKLGYFSSWADRIKNKKEYNWSKHQHYIDLPGTWCDKSNSITIELIKKLCDNDCIYTSFLNITNNLRYNKNFIGNISEEIYFLIHFLQDFHQPMHVYGDYRGGNDKVVILNYFNKTIKINFHSLWDKYIPEYYTLDTLGSYLIKSNIEHNPNNIFDFEKLLYLHTIELFSIACDITKPLKTLGNDELVYINFDTYYNQNIVNILFTKYLSFSLMLLNFIFK